MGKEHLYVLLLILLGGTCGGQPTVSTTSRETLALPAPRQQGPLSLEETLQQRRSVRSYEERTLSWEEISQLLWAVQGLTDPRGFRTAPSAGALYPLEVYLLLPEGWYHYRPQDHHLERLGEGDLRQAIWAAGLQQDPLRQAPAVLVLSAVVERSEAKYGSRAQRYVQLEAGHAAQNLLLQAVALGLGAVPIGAFEDAQVQDVLGLSKAEIPLYLIPVGKPAQD